MRSFLLFAALLPLTITFSALAEETKKSPTTKEMADKLLETGALAEASRAYAAFAHDFPKDPAAPRAFADAVIMNSRLARVDLGIAESDLQYFENTFVPINLDIWAEMVFTLIDGFAGRGDRHAATSLALRMSTLVGEWSKEAQKKKRPDLQSLREIELRTRGRLAHLYMRSGDHHGADAEYTRMQKLGAELGVWPGKKPPRNTAHFAETIDLIAETFYHAAEEKRFDAERLPLPAYIGKGDRDSVMAFINGPGTRWYENRQYLVKEAHRLYAFVLGAELPKPTPPKPPPPPSSMIGLMGGDPNAPEYASEDDPLSADDPNGTPPSPKWAIAAAERVGKLWSSFVLESRTMPIPKEWKPSPSTLVPGTDLTYGELKGEYISYVDPPDEVHKQQAKHAYRYCLDQSIRYRIVDEHSEACIAWLAKNYGAEYHVIDDFAPPGEFFALGRFTRPAPLPQFTH